LRGWRSPTAIFPTNRESARKIRAVPDTWRFSLAARRQSPRRRLVGLIFPVSGAGLLSSRVQAHRQKFRALQFAGYGLKGRSQNPERPGLGPTPRYARMLNEEEKDARGVGRHLDKPVRAPRT
jgi:hypothetical protein